MDLCAWFDEHGEIYGFQLGYDNLSDPHTLTWTKDSGYFHNRVDGADGLVKRTPILLPDGSFDCIKIAPVFLEKSGNIPKDIADFVYNKLIACI